VVLVQIALTLQLVLVLVLVLVMVLAIVMAMVSSAKEVRGGGSRLQCLDAIYGANR
jgi:hypothetical protein